MTDGPKPERSVVDLFLDPKLIPEPPAPAWRLIFGRVSRRRKQ